MLKSLETPVSTTCSKKTVVRGIRYCSPVPCPNTHLESCLPLQLEELWNASGLESMCCTQSIRADTCFETFLCSFSGVRVSTHT